MTNTQETWFTSPQHTSLEILSFAQLSDTTPIHQIRIVDVLYIATLAEAIAKLPVDGALMISFAPTVPRLVLKFISDIGVDTIEIYGGRIKTPSTGFSKESAEEQHVVAEIQSLLPRGGTL